jgi:hypothetical protein
VGVVVWIELACQLIDGLRGHDWRRQHASACRGGPGARQYFISATSSLPFRFTSSVARHAITLYPQIIHKTLHFLYLVSTVQLTTAVLADTLQCDIQCHLALKIQVLAGC